MWILLCCFEMFLTLHWGHREQVHMLPTYSESALQKILYKNKLFAFNIYLSPTFWPFRKFLKHSVLKARDVELRSGLLLSVREVHHLGGGRALVQLRLANPRPLSAVLKDLANQMRNISMWQKRQQKSPQTWESTGGTGSGLQKVSSQVRSIKDKLQV